MIAPMAMVASLAAQPEPFAATVERATALGVLRLADGRSARPQGVSAAAEPVRPGGFAQWLDEFLRGWLVAESVRVFPEKMVEDGDGVDLTVTVRLASADRWGNEAALADAFVAFSASRRIGITSMSPRAPTWSG